MKKLFIAFVALWGSVSAFAQNVEEPHFAKYLSTSDFIEKIFDYKNSKGEWNYKGTRPCMIDFYATWCGPCKALSPIVEEVAKQYEGKVDFYKVDVDKEKELAALFQIRSIPTLLFVPSTDQPSMTQGALPKEALTEFVDVLLLGQKPKNIKVSEAE